MSYTEERKEQLLKRLQELLDESDPSIKAVLVAEKCVFTCSDRSNMPSVHHLMNSVANEFGIDRGELGGFPVRKLEVLREVADYFYVERS